MGGGDEFVRAVSAAVTNEPLADPDAIRYRQEVLEDGLRDPDALRRLHELAVDAIEAEAGVYHSAFRETGESLLRRSLKVLALFMDALRALHALAEEKAEHATSRALTRFYEQILAELDDAYLAELEQHAQTLRFPRGLVLSAHLGAGNAGTDYVLRSPLNRNRGNWWRRRALKAPTYDFTIAERDQAGFEALAVMRDRGVTLAARALGESVDHILQFFIALRTDTAFYLGALNLHAGLTAIGHEVCRPVVEEPGRELRAEALYDPCLALRTKHLVVGNDLHATNLDLVVVTGANQGGKSTFLRSLGVAFLMAQSGLFVAASHFSTSTVTGLFTHFTREEDPGMTAGKFDEELARMSRITDRLRPGGLLLCNESFAATNEREGAEIAAGIIEALREQSVRIVFVTHMFDLARRYTGDDHTLFLRAERRSDGQRSYRLRVAPPEATSFGADLYQQIFHTT
ncbi:hypothetical protein [Allobranchiibius sp. GilTou73]|uniref:MutS-related protein n=1 Tax=Allobranchiibius sp. GilTou73 TaxID=2904523 RepID=UPI001F356E8A|nr:hypothetical protein [Allobranchiibius sp. GilTou73]UIJ33733.1 hypothetical protein LVQ62_11260 [Allobranchiibius sp. GilTou73]